MKRFQFPLESVRRWRAGQATLEEAKLEQLRGNLQALREEKQNIETERGRSEREVLGQASIEATDLETLDAFRLHARSKIRDIETRQRQAEVAGGEAAPAGYRSAEKRGAAGAIARKSSRGMAGSERSRTRDAGYGFISGEARQAPLKPFA